MNIEGKDKKINIEDYLIPINEIDIDDENLNVKIKEGLKNVIRFCLHYRIKKNSRIVEKYSYYLEKTETATDSNHYIIVFVAMRYYREEPEKRDTYMDKPYLKSVLNNLNEAYHEIAKQESYRMNYKLDKNLNDRVNSIIDKFNQRMKLCR
nr:10498_t:CDS:1 [Entrophospora candida]